MRKILIDKNSQKELEEKGYTKLPKILSQGDISYILKEMQELRPDDKFAPNRNEMYGFTFHTTFLDTNIDYKRSAQNLIREIFSPHIERLLSNYEILTGNFFVKPPATGELMVHRNFTFIQDIIDKTLTLWFPLVDVDETNGTIQVVEGSHSIVSHITTPTSPPFFQNFESQILNKYCQPISLRAGEVLIFDDDLLHGSGINKSASPRCVVQIVAIPKVARPVVYYLDQNSTNNQFEVFEINSDFFIENTLTDMLTRPNHLKSIGYVDNKNTILSEEEFVLLLKQSNGRNPEKNQVRGNNGKPSFFHRIKSKLKAIAR